jgi:hypothetical protein
MSTSWFTINKFKNKDKKLIKILNTIDTGPLLRDYFKLEEQLQWSEYGHKGKQAGLQYRLDEDPWTSAVGKSRGHELEYTNLNPFFANTVFEELIIQYNLKRTRLMWVYPFACYSMHSDTTPRIHVPMLTNPECYFAFKSGTIEHFPMGQVYWVDTTQPHTFINCSDHPRLHLVGVA